MEAYQEYSNSNSEGITIHNKRVLTIGYGGRSPDELITLLSKNKVCEVVDVRLRPDKAFMGTYVRSKNKDEGIQGLLGASEIDYFSFIELGNLFYEVQDWRKRYEELIYKSGDNILTRLIEVISQSRTPCLMCAEKKVTDCHRLIIANYLQTKGYFVEHIE